MGCKTGYPGTGAVINELGNYVGFFINGTDETVGVVDMTALAGDFTPTFSTVHGDNTFRVCVETDGVIEVQLADGTDFTVTAVQTANNLGQWLPLNIIKIYKAGTTATFSVGW
jgi:hypothetical protein